MQLPWKQFFSKCLLRSGLTNDQDPNIRPTLGKRPSTSEFLGFYVLVPRDQIDRNVFQEQIGRQDTAEKVCTRIEGYRKEKDDFSYLQAWYRDVFDLLVKRIDLDSWSWETEMDAIAAAKGPAEGKVVREFYGRCLKHNQ